MPDGHLTLIEKGLLAYQRQCERDLRTFPQSARDGNFWQQESQRVGALLDALKGAVQLRAVTE